MGSSKPIKLSKSEERLLKLIPKDPKRITTKALAISFYKGLQVPFNGQKIVMGTLNGLMRKLQANKSPVQVFKSERQGPKPIEVWSEGAG